MPCRHNGQSYATHYAAEGEHCQNCGFEEALVDGVRWPRFELRSAGFRALSSGRFLQFRHQPGFIHAVSTGKEPQRLPRAKCAPATSQAVTIEDYPARRIAAQDFRKLHVARNQRGCHGSILKYTQLWHSDRSHRSSHGAAYFFGCDFSHMHGLMAAPSWRHEALDIQTIHDPGDAQSETVMASCSR